MQKIMFEHRRFGLEQAVNFLPPRRWFYGHFHHSWNANINGVDYTMLGIMEMKELR